MTTRNTSQNRIAKGPPWFWAFFLYDGDSTELGAFFKTRISSLGRAWGCEVMARRIGNPRECDKVHETQRTSHRARKDEEDAEQFDHLVKARGGESHHILREQEELSELLGVHREVLPAIAFGTAPAASRFAILRIAPAWLSVPRNQPILSKALQKFLESTRVAKLVDEAQKDTESMIRLLQKQLDLLADYVSLRVSSRGPRIVESSHDVSPDDEARKFGLVIDERFHRVFYSEEEIFMSRQPFRLLLLLAQLAHEHSGWVSRDQVADYLWPEQDVSDGRIDDAVRRLRDVLRKAGCERPADIVVTKKTVGVRLDIEPEEIRVLPA